MELLEPYILKDMLGSLPPEVLYRVRIFGNGMIGYQYKIFSFIFMICPSFLKIMQELVEYYSTKGWLQRVEQCVLHMDISSLDFNQVLVR